MTSSATLVPANGVVATNNIINQRADASRSLYQICVNLRQRLSQVPGFNAYLSDADDEDEGGEMDPVSSLWMCLRKGTPLMIIYNCLQPAEPLQMDETMAAKNPKKPAFKFVEACLRDLKIPPGECFTLSDLFGDDTTGFVKVCRADFPPQDMTLAVTLLHSLQLFSYISCALLHLLTLIYPGHTSHKFCSR